MNPPPPDPAHAGCEERDTSAKTGRIRVGLLLDALVAPAWVVRMVELIVACPHAELVLVVLNGTAPADADDAGLPGRLRRNWRRLPEALVRKVADQMHDTLISRRHHLPDAQKSTDVTQFVSGVPSITIQPERSKWSDRFSDDDLARIRAHRPDVLLRCGFRILRGGILAAAKLGVWSFHHGDNRVNRGGPPCFWETMENWPETGTTLQILTEDLDNGRVIGRSWSRTDMFSVKDNRSGVCWKSLHLVLRGLESAHRLGADEFLSHVAAENAEPVFYSSRFYRRPDAWAWFRMVISKLRLKAAAVVENRTRIRQWQLRYDFADDVATTLHRYKSIIPPKDSFWADPHVIERDGRFFIFIEELPYASGRGHISVIAMDGDGKWEPPVPILKKPYHLSYPFVFQHEGRWFMIPESAEDKTVQLYECTRFPDRWEHRMNLMENVRAVDATLHHDGTLWWMFANVALEPGASTCDELFLFSSPDLFSRDWRPHPANPIVSDCKNSRPAGPIFKWNGRLYRPAQNCSKRYGYGFSLNRIDVLSPSAYRETQVTSVLPDWEKDLLATHTYARAGRLNVVDVLVRRKRWS